MDTSKQELDMNSEHAEQLGKLKLEIKDCTDKLHEHIADNDTHVGEVKADIKLMKENHLAHMQASLQTMELAMAKIATNQDWLLKFFWLLAGTVVGNMLIGLFTH